MADVPLSEVLQPEYLVAEGALRELGFGLDSRRPKGDSGGWHWYSQSSVDPVPGTDCIHNPLFDASVVLFDTGVDWLELTLYVAWGTSAPDLIVNAAVEVACWCSPNHNMHPVREVRWEVRDGNELVEAFAAGTAMLSDILGTGPGDPSSWRVRAGLPDAPSGA